MTNRPIKGAHDSEHSLAPCHLVDGAVRGRPLMHVGGQLNE